ncbi:hypothetical protein ACHAWF_017665 [Thalassiosira exigua]
MRLFRKKQETYKHAEVNLFDDAEEDAGGEQGKASSVESEDTSGTTNENSFKLSDEYTFRELFDSVFKLGSDCIIDDVAGAICGRISSVEQGQTCFGAPTLNIGIEVIKSSGSVFFRSRKMVGISHYTGKVKLSEMPIRPVLREERIKLKERGKLFVKFGLGSHYLRYTDKMFVRGCFGTAKVSAEGRVMVDTTSCLHFKPNYNALQEAAYHAREVDDVCCSRPTRVSMMSSPSDSGSSDTIPDGSLHLCWPTLAGFSFKAKRWGELAVDALDEISFNDEAFDSLVLDSYSKTLVKSLVGNIHKNMFTDIIDGKSGGCVFLLHGPPGTGKTLTAEAVSETLHRPLYCVDVGELGITPETLEEKLKEILEVAEHWNAVVLIDECDIFLTKRSANDVLRNAMVGIFLRLLEYYDGVLFLTSNRVEQLDDAFQSRISVSLEYNELDAQSRVQVWTNLLKAAGVEEVDVNKLGEYNINGRQIKTAIRLALSLAKTSGEELSSRHLAETISYAMTGAKLEK